MFSCGFSLLVWFSFFSPVTGSFAKIISMVLQLCVSDRAVRERIWLSVAVLP